MDTFPGIPRARLDELLTKMRGVKAALLGDLCLDVYWMADMRKSELSRETPHFPLPVVEERMSPGGGGNAAANMAALKPAELYAVGVVGNDWRGVELLRLLNGDGIDTEHVLRVSDRYTNAYCKPRPMGISDVVYEDPRLDFGGDKPPDAGMEDAIIRSLDRLAPRIDVLAVSDQLPVGTVTGRVRDHLAKLARDGLAVVVDSRDRTRLYRNVILKPSEVDGARAAGLPDAGNSLEDYGKAALILARRQDGEVVMTLGPRGSLYADCERATHVPAHAVPGPLDTVGAGDTFLSGFSISIAAGASRVEAAAFAGLASEVTIQQIGTTGVATPEQLVEWHRRCAAP